ncbi:MAG TPA: DNA polymerase I [Thermoanaerobaculaceae bacterium]|nr:DNA polymerase I [Thermoanaerobaculaceae bacterium]
MPRLLLVDGHSNLYRAFYAIRGGLTAPDGTPTNAAYGFLRMQHKMLREFEPTHVAVAFDAGEETFRNRLDERYKAQRPPMPEDLRSQIPLTQEALRLLGIPVLAEPDVEADDVIGTLAARAAKAGFEVVIASTDKDLMQLVADPHVKMWHTRLERMLDEKGVEEVFGVPPAQVGEVLAIMGDTADNIPGCKGIGEKGALELIRAWGSVDNVYAHLDEVKPPRAQKALTEHRAEVELSQQLVRIRADLELAETLDSLGRRPADESGLAGFYQRLGFASLLAELQTTAEPPATPAAAAGRSVDTGEAARLLARGGAGVALEAGRLAIAAGDEVAVVAAAPPELARLLAPHLGGVWTHDAKALLAALNDGGANAGAAAKDTMLAAYLLGPGEPTELPAVCGRFGVPAPPADTAEERARAVAALAPVLAKRIKQDGVERVFLELELPLVPVLEAMERHGIRLDLGVLEELGRRLAASLAELEREIHAEAGAPFNINSPQQLADVLFQRKGLPVLRRTAKTKAPSTDADVLAELASRGHRLPALLLEYREQTKLKSTYVDTLPREIAADGRVHTRFNQAVAATGRLSSSDPNLQNIPVRTEMGREVRRAFVADPGDVLLAADYSQIELRVLAHMSEDPALEAAFAAGEDIHRATAALVFGIAPELVGPDQRRAAKTINFGLIYGMSAFALARELGVANAEAQRFIDAYFARLPRVREFLDGIKEQARSSGKVTTLFGRVRWISGLDSHNSQVRGNAERQAINAPVQGTAADLMKVAMIKLHGELASRRLPARLLLQVHDELILEVARDAADEVGRVAREVMESAAALRVPLKVDIGVGVSWAAAKG